MRKSSSNAGKNRAHTNAERNKEGEEPMDFVALILSIIGCLNWGAVGIFGFDAVAWLFGGQGSPVSRIIYTVVGLAGLWCISLLFRRNSLGAAENL